MANSKHPYTAGGAGGIVQAISQLRKSFPSPVTAETLKKLGIAPNNESMILSILRFINIIDAEGKKTKEANSVFTQHEDEAFQKGLTGLVKAGYKGLFDLHGDSAWSLPSAKLITFFRNADHTSEVVGTRQALTFQALAGLAGHGAAPTPRAVGAKTGSPKKPATKATTAKTAPNSPATILGTGNGTSEAAVGLTVRIEINLPAGGDKDTYDNIFKSIRENLLRGQ